MARRDQVVVAKRGCTCCGTGCVVMLSVFPLSVFALFETVGVVAAAALWPALILGAHVVRYATDNPKYIHYRRPKVTPKLRGVIAVIFVVLSAAPIGSAAANRLRAYYITERSMDATLEERHQWGGSHSVEILDAACMGQGYWRGRFPYRRYHLFLCYVTAAGGWAAEYHFNVKTNGRQIIYTPTLIDTYRSTP